MILLLLITILICFLILIIPFEKTFGIFNTKVLKKLSELPGPAGLPILGVGLEICALTEHEFLSYLMSLIERFPRICKFWVIMLPLVIINEPEDIEVIMSSVKHINKGYEYNSLAPWLNEGLLLSKGKVDTFLGWHIFWG